jgi:DNA topoisomerase I
MPSKKTNTKKSNKTSKNLDTSSVKNLVIVESPAKSKTIQKILGANFEVKASFWHIVDLSKKKMGIDIDNNFMPNYEVSLSKKKVLRELQQHARKADVVRIATDEDREWEAIGRHILQELKLPVDTTPRIVFHEITPSAIKHAVANPRYINLDLVNAQQARRILDRIVWFELSPILRRKIKTWLSAGRVQSVAVKLIVERERETQKFTPTSTFKITAECLHKNGNFIADYKGIVKTSKEAHNILETIANKNFIVKELETKPGTKSPTAPFTTSTLQQEASRKIAYSVSRTMSIAQKLYEAGHITYMRTDSINISKTAIAQAAKVISENYGKEYSQVRVFKTKKKGAQEAHECIRPTHFERKSAGSTPEERKLYDLIWKRAIASQMANAKVENTTITLDVPDSKHTFVAKWQIITFDGFLKVYLESHDENHDDEQDSGILPKLKKGEDISYKQINAIQKYSRHPARYTEASLVKKLEEEGIGRPSTYAPTIATIQKREYVTKSNLEGESKPYTILTLQKNKITSKEKKVIYGADKNKLIPTDIGLVVNDFLLEYFPNILDYGFTADIEEKFDQIAHGKLEWTKMLKKFYDPFHTDVLQTAEKAPKSKGERELGIDPVSKKPVIAKIGRYGPMIQIGSHDDEEKPKFAALRNASLENVTLEQALEMFKLPRSLGDYQDHNITVSIGRFGPYIKRNDLFASIKSEDDAYTISRDKAIEYIEEKREKQKANTLKERNHDGKHILITKGRRGPYVKINGKSYKLPKKIDLDNITPIELLKLIW